MKRLIVVIAFLIIYTASFGQANNLLVKTSRQKKEKVNSGVSFEPQNYYKYRTDGKPGRGVVINFNGEKFIGKGTLTLEYNNETSEYLISSKDSISTYEFLLEPNIAKEESIRIKVSLHSKSINYSGIVNVPSFRHWEIMIYPHSHVDIGYTNTHENVELIHTRNLIHGLELAKKTRDYPEGARYKWNPEVIWPVERYLAKASEKEKQTILDGIKDGYLALDAGYVNVNTSVAGDEELFEFFRQATGI